MLPNFLKKGFSRRRFLAWLSKAAITALMLPFNRFSPAVAAHADDAASVPATPAPTGVRIHVQDTTGNRLLLQNGLIVDGTGRKGYRGSLMIQDSRIELVTDREVAFSGTSMDCSGKVIAPGFIDMHSHMDWVLPVQGHGELKTPFTAQGITSFVGGNCGFGVAAFKADSNYRDLLEIRTMGLYKLQWNTMAEYFDHLSRHDLSHNLASLAGYGTTRTSICGFDPDPLNQDQRRQLLYLLEEALDQGAYGVSFGLQYEPGVFAKLDELKEVARLVRSKDKIVTVHMKAYSALSGTYPLKPFGRPHNLLAIEEMLDVARETGVRLQLSHLIFVGTRTMETCAEALELIDRAITEGVDVQFDTYAYHCGTSIINVVLPEWFLARIPDVYESRLALLRLRAEFQIIKTLLGFGYGDIQITDARHPELDKYNGMFLKEIAAQRGLGQFENFVDFARKSRGRARVLNHRYSSLDNLKTLMRHPRSLYMTDAIVAPKGAQNPAAFGNYPRLLQYARDFKLQSLEETVHKMTGAPARRFGLADRGILRKGCAADITVFDWNAIADNNTLAKTDQAPTGIERVFINGVPVHGPRPLPDRLAAGRVL